MVEREDYWEGDFESGDIDLSRLRFPYDPKRAFVTRKEVDKEWERLSSKMLKQIEKGEE